MVAFDLDDTLAESKAPLSDAMARTLAELLGDDARTQALAAVGQAHVHAAFDRQRMRQQYLALFADLAARKGVVRT